MTDLAQTDLVLTERPDERVAHLVLNRPERRNALTGPLVDEFITALDELNADEAVNVIVIRGAGGAFCSGLDLKEFGAEPQPDWVADFGAKWASVHRRIFDSTKIIVGALERAAVNGGAALALACDLLIAGEQSFLQVGEVQQGMAAPMNTAWLRLRFDEATAARLALIGDRVHGPELVRLGVAYRSVPDEQVLDAVSELTATLATHEPVGVSRIKTSIRRMAVDQSAEEWFGRALAVDPLQGRRMRPVAARDT